MLLPLPTLLLPPLLLPAAYAITPCTCLCHVLVCVGVVLVPLQVLPVDQRLNATLDDLRVGAEEAQLRQDLCDLYVCMYVCRRTKRRVIYVYMYICIYV
jgi:hypothetical protein